MPWMQKAIGTSTEAGRKTTNSGEMLSQRTGEAGASPHPSHVAWSHQVVLPHRQGRVTSPRELQAKIKSIPQNGGGGDDTQQKSEWGWKDCCMVILITWRHLAFLDPFQFLSHSLPYISKLSTTFTWPKWICFHQKHLEKGILSPQKGKTKPTTFFLKRPPPMNRCSIQKLQTGCPQSLPYRVPLVTVLCAWVGWESLLFGKKYMFCYMVGDPATKWQPTFSL